MLRKVILKALDDYGLTSPRLGLEEVAILLAVDILLAELAKEVDSIDQR